jgi:hypothetical protein
MIQSALPTTNQETKEVPTTQRCTAFTIQLCKADDPLGVYVCAVRITTDPASGRSTATFDRPIPSRILRQPATCKPRKTKPTTLILEGAEQNRQKLHRILLDTNNYLLHGTYDAVNGDVFQECGNGREEFFQDDVVANLFNNIGQLLWRWSLEVLSSVSYERH